ncbi:MAG: AAA family ATPase [Methylococcaceae bacterium]
MKNETEEERVEKLKAMFTRREDAPEPEPQPETNRRPRPERLPPLRVVPPREPPPDQNRRDNNFQYQDYSRSFETEPPVQKKDKKPIEIVTIEEFLKHQFPVREYVFNPVFTLGSCNMIFSDRGVGKTHVGLGLAYPAASGTQFWDWKATRPFKTLYIDGEMPGEALQERLAKIVQASEAEPSPDFFKLITIDLNDGAMPDLSNLGGQLEIETACNEAELIIVDNLSCLARSGKENEAESWGSLSQWALRMRSHGKCVIFMHHAGKSGAQRGTSKREDLLDVVLELKRPTDYVSDQGARFIVNFSKARHLIGNQAQSFEAWLRCDEDGRQVWTLKAASESTFDQVVEMSNLGMSQREIADELGINKSNVCRAWKSAKEKGLIRETTRRTQGKKDVPHRADIDD